MKHKKIINYDEKKKFKEKKIHKIISQNSAYSKTKSTNLKKSVLCLVKERL